MGVEKFKQLVQDMKEGSEDPQEVEVAVTWLLTPEILTAVEVLIPDTLAEWYQLRAQGTVTQTPDVSFLTKREKILIHLKGERIVHPLLFEAMAEAGVGDNEYVTIKVQRGDVDWEVKDESTRKSRAGSQSHIPVWDRSPRPSDGVIPIYKDDVNMQGMSVQDAVMQHSYMRKQNSAFAERFDRKVWVDCYYILLNAKLVPSIEGLEEAHLRHGKEMTWLRQHSQ